MLLIAAYPILLWFTDIPWLQRVVGAFGVLIYSMFLVYDTQLILGRGEMMLMVDDYVFGALRLYVDIIGLFLYLLQILTGGGRR